MFGEENNYGIEEGGWNSDAEQDVDDKILEELDAEEKGEKKETKEDDDEDTEEDKDEKEDDDSDEDDDDAGSDEDTQDEDEDSDKDKDGDDETDDDDSDDEDDEDSEDEDEVDVEALIAERKEKLKEKYESLDDEAAQKMAEGDYKVAEKYGKDPIEIAHAYRSLQGEYTQLNEQVIQQRRESVNPYAFLADKVIITDRTSGKRKEMSKEEYVEAYRDKYKEADPELVDMGDDEVYRDAKRKNGEWLKAVFNRHITETNDKAKTNRKSIVASLKGTADEKFSKDVEELLGHYSDDVVSGEGFNGETALLIAKGKKYDADTKAEREKGVKTGKKKSKLIDKKVDGPVGKGKSSGKKGSYKGRLSKQERESALDMYDGDKISDEDKYKLYYDDFGQKKKK